MKKKENRIKDLVQEKFEMEEKYQFMKDRADQLEKEVKNAEM